MVMPLQPECRQQAQVPRAGELDVRSYQWNERLVERKVTYTLEVNGQLIVIENVPARVNVDTGEQLFSPDTVERLQKMVWEQKQPKRVIQVPVYEFA
jgi:YgiT-type zinc finger domain-containing protein